MKNILLFSFCFLFVQLGYTQAPNKFRYQAVARNQSGTIITGNIDIQLSFLEDGPDGNNRYAEQHTVTTNSQGVFDLTINEGALVSGNKNLVDWKNHEYWLKVEIKTPGEVTFTEMGKTQLLSVPYAMFAASSGDELSAGNGISMANGLITNTGDLSDQNEIQTLSINGTQLTISEGNAVTLPTGTTYDEGSGININGNVISADDTSPSNELQQLSISGNQLILSNANSVTLPSNSYSAGTGIQINNNTITAVDASTTNEIQTLSLNGQQLTLSNGGGSVVLPGAGASSWTLANTDITSSPSSNNVVIGSNNNFNSKLYVAGSGTQMGGNFYTPGTGDAVHGYNNSTGSGISGSSLSGRGGNFTSVSGAGAYFSSSNGPALITETGNVGIGVLNPVRKLQVNGATLLTNPGGDVALEIGAGKVGVGITSPTYKFQVNGASYLENLAGPSLLIGQGNVGIGTTAPTYKLAVMGGSEDGIFTSSDGYGINAVSTGPYAAGYFHSSVGVAGFFTSDDNSCILAAQGATGTPSNGQGILLRNGGLSWKAYIDAASDYNLSFNASLKAYITDTDGSYHNTSDRRLKKDIHAFDNVLTRLTQLQAYTYHMIDAADDSPISVGFMAQDVESQFPQLVVEKNGFKTICYDHFAVLSVEAIKEQQTEIDELKKQVTELKDMVNALLKK